MWIYGHYAMIDHAIDKYCVLQRHTEARDELFPQINITHRYFRCFSVYEHLTFTPKELYIFSSKAKVLMKLLTTHLIKALHSHYNYDLGWNSEPSGPNARLIYGMAGKSQ